jgi:hypothetical protein
MSLRFATVVLLGLAAVIAGGGCVTRCSGACAEAGAIIDIRALTAPIVSAGADPPCSVNQDLLEDGGPGAEVDVGVTGTSPGSCQIHATLADGSTWVATLSWAFGDNGPCCTNVTYNVGPAPVFMRSSDGGK